MTTPTWIIGDGSCVSNRRWLGENGSLVGAYALKIPLKLPTIIISEITQIKPHPLQKYIYIYMLKPLYNGHYGTLLSIEVSSI